MHQLVMGRVWEIAPHPDARPDEAPGGYRRHNIRPFGGGMTPPPWTEVPAALTSWVDDVDALAGGTDPDAWLLNLVLVRLGFPPAIVVTPGRDRYLTALDRADHDEPGPFAELLDRSVIDNPTGSWYRDRRTRPPRAPPRLAIPDVTYETLRQAARRGRLEAHQASAGTWRSTRTAVDIYLNRHHQER